MTCVHCVVWYTVMQCSNFQCGTVHTIHLCNAKAVHWNGLKIRDGNPGWWHDDHTFPACHIAASYSCHWTFFSSQNYFFAIPIKILHATLLPASLATELFAFALSTSSSCIFLKTISTPLCNPSDHTVCMAIPDDHTVYMPHCQLLSHVESTGSFAFIFS